MLSEDAPEQKPDSTGAKEMSALSILITKIDHLCAQENLQDAVTKYEQLIKDPLVVNHSLAASQDVKRLEQCMNALRRRTMLKKLNPDERLQRQIQDAKKEHRGAVEQLTDEHNRYMKVMLTQYREKQCTKENLNSCLADCKDERITCRSGATDTKERRLCSQRGTECSQHCKQDDRTQHKSCQELWRGYKPVHEKEIRNARRKFNEAKNELNEQRNRRIRDAKRNRSYIDQPGLRSVHEAMDSFAQERQALRTRFTQAKAALTEQLKDAKCPDRRAEAKDLVAECAEESQECMQNAGNDRSERRACARDSRRCKKTVYREVDQMLRGCKRNYDRLKKRLGAKRTKLTQARRDALADLKKRQRKAVGDLRAPSVAPGP